MNKELVQTDSFVLKKYNLRIYKVAEPNTAVLLWTSEQPAFHYVRKLNVQKLIAEKKLKQR